MADGGSGKTVKLAVVAVGLLVGVGSLVWYMSSGSKANEAVPIEPVAQQDPTIPTGTSPETGFISKPSGPIQRK